MLKTRQLACLGLTEIDVVNLSSNLITASNHFIGLFSLIYEKVYISDKMYIK